MRIYAYEIQPKHETKQAYRPKWDEFVVTVLNAIGKGKKKIFTDQ